MGRYTQKDLLRTAKRVNNTKRAFLLVNPLQAKHIPVSPSESLRMMNTLGDILAKKYPETRLVIGFAETATAIGAAVASRFAGDCVYLHTTRESVPEVTDWVLFSEEHSHAVEQKLSCGRLSEWIADTETIVFVDDEISTGKTLLNMIQQLKDRWPLLSERRLVASSLLNRVSPEDELRLSDGGLQCEWLVKLTEDNAAGAVSALQAREAPPVEAAGHTFSQKRLDCGSLPDSRKGVPIRSYLEGCQQLAHAFLEMAGPDLQEVRRLVVLGTEECMYPALVLGKELEERGFSVRCHATTRSPIGICGAPNYPITSGNKLSSFYEDGRNTYLYNFTRCDALVVVSDAPFCNVKALNQLAAAWMPYGVQKIFFVQGGQNVWYL